MLHLTHDNSLQLPEAWKGKSLRRWLKKNSHTLKRAKRLTQVLDEGMKVTKPEVNRKARRLKVIHPRTERTKLQHTAQLSFLDVPEPAPNVPTPEPYTDVRREKAIGRSYTVKTQAQTTVQEPAKVKTWSKKVNRPEDGLSQSPPAAGKNGNQYLMFDTDGNTTKTVKRQPEPVQVQEPEVKNNQYLLTF